jgi:hypothetical protein
MLFDMQVDAWVKGTKFYQNSHIPTVEMSKYSPPPNIALYGRFIKGMASPS